MAGKQCNQLKRLRITVIAIDSGQAEATARRLISTFQKFCGQAKGPVPLRKVKGDYTQPELDNSDSPPIRYDNVTIHKRLVVLQDLSEEIAENLESFPLPRNVTLRIAYI